MPVKNHTWSNSNLQRLKTPEERFWEKVEKGAVSDCWNWSGAVFVTGYGHMRINGKDVSAHRFSWVVANKKPIPPGEGSHGSCVLHKCDNRKCVNPGHLFLGTHRENIDDMLAKGMGKSNEGINNPRAKLSVSDVRRIRHLCGKMYQYKIASIFGITQAQVSSIHRRESWASVE